MAMPEGEHKERLMRAIELEAEGQRLLLDDDRDGRGRELMAEAAGQYRESWLLAPPASFGRLVGMLKAQIIAGSGVADAAEFARAELPDPPPSPAAAYALALACMAERDDVTAVAATKTMREGSDAFVNAAEAITALAREDRAGYGRALATIIEDFEGRTEHLTGVAIADTALMLERLADQRGMALHPESGMLPAG